MAMAEIRAIINYSVKKKFLSLQVNFFSKQDKIATGSNKQLSDVGYADIANTVYSEILKFYLKFRMKCQFEMFIIRIKYRSEKIYNLLLDKNNMIYDQVSNNVLYYSDIIEFDKIYTVKKKNK